MTAEEFKKWLDEGRRVGAFASDAAAGRCLGITPHGILKMKKRGADKRTALACAAIIYSLSPYS